MSDPENDEMYCSECGSVIKRKAEICPECGVRVSGSESQSPGASDNVWAMGGLLSFLVGLVILPVIFGPLTIFAGYVTHKKSDGWFVGTSMMLGGILEFLLAAWIILYYQSYYSTILVITSTFSG